MWWVVLGHLGVPFVFGVAFVVFATAAGRNPPTWDIALETALDLAVLGIGATGSIFENGTIAKAFGIHAAVVGIAVVGINFLLSSVIVLIRRFVYEHTPRKLFWGSFAISLGFIFIGDVDGFGVCLSSGIVVFGRVDMGLLVKLTLVVVVAAGIMGTGLGLLVKFIVEANQNPHDRIAGAAEDASRK